jgi:hypothetical protein
MNYSDEWKSLGIAIAKLPEETNDNYQAFLAFAWLQGKERSCELVAERTGFGLGTCKIWQMQYRWLERASAVDAQRWLHEHSEREKLLAKDNEEFINANRKVKRKSLQLSNKMLGVASKLLDDAEMSGKVTETGMIETKDGRMVPTLTTIEMKAKISDIPRLVDTAVKVARLAADLPTEIINDLGVRPGTDFKDLSLEELQELQASNRKRLLENGAVQSLGDVD